MEEKERYEFGQRTLFYSGEELTTFDGFNLDDFMRIICKLLNQQDKEIIKLRGENQQLKKQLEIFKISNDALQQDNLDLSYDKVDIAYEYAKEMAENWEKDYQEEIKQLKQSQNQVAIDELEKFKNYIFTRIYLTANGDEEKINTYVDLKIKELKGE